MSVESDVNSGAHAAAEPAAPAAAPAANPALLGLMTFLPSGIALGLWFVGYLDTTALPGGMVAIVTFSAGLFLLIATVSALRGGASTVAAIFGVFSAFWLSFGFLVHSLNNGWIVNAGATSPAESALTAAQVGEIQAAYLLSFLIVFVILTLATLRLPIAFTAGFVFVVATFALAFLGVSTANAALFPIAGYCTFIFCAIFAYILVDGIGQDLGGKALPLGSPIQR